MRHVAQNCPAGALWLPGECDGVVVECDGVVVECDNIARVKNEPVFGARE